MVESRQVPGQGRIRASIEKLSREYRKRVESLCVPKMVESGRVPGKGRIRPSIDNLRRGVPENGRIYVSTENSSNPGEYREKVESVRVSRICTGEIGRAHV